MDLKIVRSVGAGRTVLRTEDRRLLTGRGRYVENLDLGATLHGCFVRSPYAHAEIGDVNASAALGGEDVVAVFSGADLIAAGLGPLPFHQVMKREDGEDMQPPARFALAVGRVRFSGEAVALVVAKTRKAASDAAELVEVAYTELPVVVGARDAYDRQAPQLASGAPRNTAGIVRVGNKDATDAAFALAAHVTHVSLHNQRLSACPMETRSVVAECDPASGRLTLHTGNQAPHMAREHLAGALGIAIDDLRISVTDIGGGFGMKLVAYPEELALLHAARALRTKIRWKADRTESMLSDNHGRDHDTDAEMAFDADGRILAVRLRVFANMGAYLSYFGVTVAAVSGNRVISNVYRIPAMDVEVRTMLTNTAPIGPYRGAGRPEAIYRIERLIDIAAHDMKVDPVALRRMNLVTPEEIPYRAASGQIYDSGNFPRLLDAALTAADWDGFPSRRDEAASRGMLAGRGLCCHIDTTSGLLPSEEVRITASHNGSITVFSGTQAMGQGLATVYSSMAATYLGLPIGRIEIVQGDTDRVADGVGSYGSRSLFIGGSALVVALDAMVEKLRGKAAGCLGLGVDDIEFVDGAFTGPSSRIAILDVLSKTGEVEARGRYESTFVFPNGCYVCEVEVDPATGVIAVKRFSGVDDVGTVIHPAIVHGQVQGSVAQGIAQALWEEVVYDESGQLLSASLMDYGMPRADVLPRFHFKVDETSPCLGNPLGADRPPLSGPFGMLVH